MTSHTISAIIAFATLAFSVGWITLLVLPAIFKRKNHGQHHRV
jgi:hypothetical protein